MNQATETIDREPIVDCSETVRTRAAKAGDVGAHRVAGVRGYRVMRLKHIQERQQLAFSTLSADLLCQLGRQYVDRIGI